MFSLSRACLLVGVACGLGMIVLGGRESRAESITMTIVANGRRSWSTHWSSVVRTPRTTARSISPR